MRQQITATDAADIALRFELNKLTESPNQVRCHGTMVVTFTDLGPYSKHMKLSSKPSRTKSLPREADRLRACNSSFKTPKE